MEYPNTPKILPSALSESQQMYLVTIARQQTRGEPIPLSDLAEALSVSPVSVNEMCRRLQEQGLVVYQPYKGVSLTAEGERHARYVLRRHRLWEVFLVEKLGFDYDQAHDAACQLEHATPDVVSDHLDAFLGRPSVNPKGDVIPKTNGSVPARSLLSLAALSAGRQAHVVSREVDEGARAFLDERGLRPGASVVVVAATEGSLLVRVEGAHVSLGRALAEGIQVEADEKKVESGIEHTSPASTAEEEKEKSRMGASADTVRQVRLHELNVGQRGVVARVGGEGPVKRRMIDMGLVPGTEVRVVRVAPMGDPVEIEVKGYNLSLRKSEARHVTVDVPAE